MFALGNFRAVKFPSTFSFSGSIIRSRKYDFRACAIKNTEIAGNMPGQNSQIRKNYWNLVGIMKIRGAPIWKTWGKWPDFCQNSLNTLLFIIPWDRSPPSDCLTVSKKLRQPYSYDCHNILKTSSRYTSPYSLERSGHSCCEGRRRGERPNSYLTRCGVNTFCKNSECRCMLAIMCDSEGELNDWLMYFWRWKSWEVLCGS